MITQELAGKWGTLRKTETKVTLAGRISVLRQLSLYMQAYGIKCYIPRNFTRKSNRSAYVLSIEEIQSLFLEIDSYQPTINAEVFHRLALEYRILFRTLFCCGLRVSEARKLRLDTVDLENGVLKIYQSKGSNDRLVYLPDDLRQLCCEYLKIMTVKYKIKSEWVLSCIRSSKSTAGCFRRETFPPGMGANTLCQRRGSPANSAFSASYVCGTKNERMDEIWCETG